jgi:hypothetical protein
VATSPSGMRRRPDDQEQQGQRDPRVREWQGLEVGSPNGLRRAKTSPCGGRLRALVMGDSEPDDGLTAAS